MSTSPYAYMIEHALALGILTSAQIKSIGLKPADFSPDLRAIKGRSYKGRPLPEAKAPPYSASDPVIAALARGFDQNLVSYHQIDLIGLHPAHLPGADNVIKRRQKTAWSAGKKR